MALNRINAGGDFLEITSASTARTSGDVVLYSSDTVGIVADTVAASAEYRAFVRGTFELAKNTGLPFAVGEDLGWDISEAELTTNSTLADHRIGVCARAATTLAGKARILLGHANAILVAQVS